MRQTFHRLLNEVTCGLSFVVVCLGDILAASRSASKHKLHIRHLFQRLDDPSLVLKPQKRVFGVEALNLLGPHITAEGIRPLESRVESINNFSPPTSFSKLWEFLGLANFYRPVIPSRAQILQPLTDLLGRAIRWWDEHQNAFHKDKDELATTTILIHSLPDAPTRLIVDASSTSVGAVLPQQEGTEWKPLGFFSKRLKPSGVCYSTLGKQMLAIYCAINHFRFFSKVELFTS